MKKNILLSFITIVSIMNASATSAFTSEKAKENSFCCLAGLSVEEEESSANKNTTTVPFIYNNRLIKLNAAIIAGQDQHEFILDSGAPTFLTDSMTKAHDLKETNTETAFDADGNEQKVSFYNVKSMEIGGKQIKNTRAASSQNVSKMPILKGQPYAGLIGANAMKHNIWMINYNCREIIITDSINSLAVPSNAFSTKLKLDEWGRPMINMCIDGKHTMCFIVDVGYNGSILLPERYLSKPVFNDSLSYTRSESISTGFASNVKQVDYKFLNHISIGDMKLENVKASTTGKNSEALIGNEFLENYIIILDFVNKRMIFLPAAKGCGNLYS